MCHAPAHIFVSGCTSWNAYSPSFPPALLFICWHLLIFCHHLKYLFFHVFLTVNQCNLWYSVILCNHLLIHCVVMIYLRWPMSFSKKGTKSYSCFLPEKLLWELLLSVYYILEYALGPFEYRFSFDPPHPLWMIIKAHVNLGFEKFSALFCLTQLRSVGAEI